nr:MAG TPA: RNA polymerase inhibitor [Caudoviricetes sp.]
MIYEAEIEQTVMGRIFIKADNLEQAKQVAKRCVEDEQNLVNVDFDEIWGYDVRDVSEADTVGNEEIIKAEDVL